MLITHISTHHGGAMPFSLIAFLLHLKPHNEVRMANPYLIFRLLKIGKALLGQNKPDLSKDLIFMMVLFYIQ
jgi:hypothetical protein